MSLEDNKTVVRRYLEEAIIQGNLDVIDTSFAPHVVLHFYNTPPHSHTSFRKIIEQFHQAVSGYSLTIHDLIAEGNTVAVRHSSTAAMHHGQFGNNPPTGQPFQLESALFFRFEQGKVVEMWHYYHGANWDLSPA